MATVAPARVLVAEDDRGVRESLVRGLRLEGYEVAAVNDGARALDAVQAEVPDVVVLDVMMPVLDGLAACRELRRHHAGLPILLLTARHEVGDRVAGLDAGADDYVVKPYAMSELAARLRALLRRTSVSGAQEAIVVGDLVVDPAARMAWRNGRELALTKTEFDLLELLVFNAGVVLSRDTIYERIWGYDFETTSARPRRLRRLPPSEDGGTRRVEAGAHDPRRRLRRPRAMSLRWRIAAALAGVAVVVGVLAAVGRLRDDITAAALEHRRVVGDACRRARGPGAGAREPGWAGSAG